MLSQDHLNRMKNWPLGNFLSHKQESPRNPNMSDSFFLEFQNMVYDECDDNIEKDVKEVFLVMCILITMKRMSTMLMRKLWHRASKN